MKKSIQKKLVLMLMGCIVCFTACDLDTDKNGPVTVEKAIEALTEFAKTSNQFSATVKESGNRVDDTGLNDTKNLYGTKSYPIVSCEAQGNGSWLVICNYGPSLILCDDGYFRRGTVKILTTGLFTTPETVMTLTFEDFYQKSDALSLEYKIEGTQVITNAGANKIDPEMTDYNVTVTDGLITYNAKKIHYSETTVRTLSLNTTDLCENNWYITGEWNGISSDNVSYNLKANSTPLHFRLCCHYFQNGILNIDVDGLPAFSIDYGYSEEESDCDNKALLSYPGITPIVLNM